MRGRDQGSRPAMVFVGFMGAGKSQALKAAAASGLEATETDELLERELGTSIAEFFESEGEAAFREREAEIVGSLLEALTAARSRSAAAACSPSGSATRSTATPSSGCRSASRMPGVGPPAETARWPATRPSSARFTRSACRSTRSSPTW